MNIRRSVSLAIVLALVVQTVIPARAELLLSAPGQMLGLSQSYNPPVLKGIKVFPKEPLRFDFILDPGTGGQNDPERLRAKRGGVEGLPQDKTIEADANRLIKYFLASLTIPEQDLWVNLSPYEKDRIIPEAFGQTEMGRDLLAQDYLLKQITASLLYPEGETGKAFWKKVYALAQEKYGTTDIPVDTFNKVWIVPDMAEVYENAEAGAAYITGSRLKVMLETDYLADEMARSDPVSRPVPGEAAPRNSESPLSSDIAKAVLREIVIPVLEKEVNEGANFAPLRQVYQSLILATWYKKKIKQSLLSAVYVDQKKTEGVNIADHEEAEKIWEQYVEAFRKGAYNFIRDEKDVFTDGTVSRKYLSGGMKLDLDFSMESSNSSDSIEMVGMFLRLSVYLRDLRMFRGIKQKKLYAGDKINPHGLVLVHLSSGIPKNGRLYPNVFWGEKAYLLKMPREIVEFTWNAVLPPDSVRDSLAVTLIPYDLVDRTHLINFWYTATSFLGPVEIPKGSSILVFGAQSPTLVTVEQFAREGIDMVYCGEIFNEQAIQEKISRMGYEPFGLHTPYGDKNLGGIGFSMEWARLSDQRVMTKEPQKLTVATKIFAEEEKIPSFEPTDGYPLGFITINMERLFDSLVKSQSSLFINLLLMDDDMKNFLVNLEAIEQMKKKTSGLERVIKAAQFFFRLYEICKETAYQQNGRAGPIFEPIHSYLKRNIPSGALLYYTDKEILSQLGGRWVEMMHEAFGINISGSLKL